MRMFGMAAKGPESSAEREQLIAIFGGQYDANEDLTEIIGKIKERIVKASDDPDADYRITILNSPSINAFALPSGDIFLTRGLIALANDTAELGAVIAHEIAHVTARHATRRAELEKTVTPIPEEIGADTTQMTGNGNRFTLASFSRTQELEADAIGIKTLARAGYDPYGASRFLLALNRTVLFDHDQTARRNSRAGFLSSHPSTPQRLSVAIDTAAAHLSPKSIEADRNSFLLALEGLDFGEDPESGVIRGTQFFHPRLDFTFTAPDKFLLENSPEAVIGMTVSREQSMRLDTLTGISPEASLKLGWIDGAMAEEITPIDIAGHSAFTTTAQDNEWHYRLAAIEKEDRLFRMIFAARQLTPEIDMMFLNAIRSFRALSQPERDSIRPLRLAVARAEAGDSVDTFAEQMSGVSRAQDLFRRLNNIEKNEIRPGTLYKIAVPQ